MLTMHRLKLKPNHCVSHAVKVQQDVSRRMYSLGIQDACELLQLLGHVHALLNMPWLSG